MNARSVFSHLWMISAATVITLLLGEVAIRTLLPQELSVWSLTPEGLIVHRPSSRAWSPRFGRAFRFNAMGMRDVEHTVEKPDGRYRVLLLGDSFTEGFQVDPEDMVARRLEQTLAPRVGMEVEVLNAGVSGWGTDHELFYVMQNGRDLEPDLIVYALTLYTDIGDNLAMQFHYVEAGALRERPIVSEGGGEGIETKLKELLAAHSQLFQFVRSGLRSDDDAVAAQALESQFVDVFLRAAPERLAFGRAYTASLFQKAADVSEELGVPSAIVMIPMAMQLSQDEYTAFLEANDLDPGAAARDWPQTSLRRDIDEATGKRLPIIDLLPPFQAAAQGSSRNLFTSVDEHWNARGQALAAEVIAAELDRLGLLPKPRSKPR